VVTMKNAIFLMLRRVVLVRTEVSEERSASFETSFLTRTIRCNIPEDRIILVFSSF
jgi:hypothetical protein